MHPEPGRRVLVHEDGLLTLHRLDTAMTWRELYGMDFVLRKFHTTVPGPGVCPAPCIVYKPTSTPPAHWVYSFSVPLLTVVVVGVPLQELIDAHLASEASAPSMSRTAGQLLGVVPLAPAYGTVVSAVPRKASTLMGREGWQGVWPDPSRSEALGVAAANTSAALHAR